MPYAAFSYSKPGDFMKHFVGSKCKKKVYSILIPAALLYSLFLCITGVHTAISKQMELHLFQRIWAAQQFALEGEEQTDPVYLRRDQNNQITAITVNGILLNQIQAQYSQFLYKDTSAYPVRLNAADFLGKLFFWVPGSLSFSVSPEVKWDAEVLSRTFSQDETTRCFQVILTTTGNARVFPWQNIKIQEELVLYEALLYG